MSWKVSNPNVSFLRACLSWIAASACGAWRWHLLQSAVDVFQRRFLASANHDLMKWTLQFNRRLGGAQPGNRFVSFVRAYARSGSEVGIGENGCNVPFPFPFGSERWI